MNIEKHGSIGSAAQATSEQHKQAMADAAAGDPGEQHEQPRTYAELFAKAARAAEAADPGPDEDRGTCNLDSPAFRIERMPKKTIERHAQESGLTVCDFQWFGGRRWYWLNVPLRGQANRRTRMAEAANKVLREAAQSGQFPRLHACCYMQMD